MAVRTANGTSEPRPPLPPPPCLGNSLVTQGVNCQTGEMILPATLWMYLSFAAAEIGGHPRPNPAAKPFTCAKGQPGADLPFCNRALGFVARSHDLASRLNITEHVNLFFSYPGTPWIERLNLKGWSLDHTCIHGLNKAHGVTVFPHAIAQVSQQAGGENLNFVSF